VFVFTFHCDFTLHYKVCNIVDDCFTKIVVAMELCKKVQVQEYSIHIVGSTNFYTHLQFSLLASTWFPRPLGVCLWSVLHVLLVIYKALVLLVLFPFIFVLAILADARADVGMIFFSGSCLVVFLILLVISTSFVIIDILLYISIVILLMIIISVLKETYYNSLTQRFVNHVILVWFPYQRGQLEDLCREIVSSSDIIVI